jgi:hypothetical protein
MKTQTHSERALAAAMAVMEPCADRTAVTVLWFAIANEALRLMGPEKAAALAYGIADGFALLVEPK